MRVSASQPLVSLITRGVLSRAVTTRCRLPQRKRGGDKSESAMPNTGSMTVGWCRTGIGWILHDQPQRPPNSSTRNMIAITRSRIFRILRRSSLSVLAPSMMRQAVESKRKVYPARPARKQQQKCRRSHGGKLIEQTVTTRPIPSRKQTLSTRTTDA